MSTSNTTVPTPDLTALLDEIQGRADAATKGTWDYVVLDDGRAWVDMAGVDGHALAMHGFGRNAAFIADARTTVPALVAALRAVLDAMDRWSTEPDRAFDRGYAVAVLNHAITTALSAVTR